jgi:hypothetical protein
MPIRGLTSTIACGAVAACLTAFGLSAAAASAETLTLGEQTLTPHEGTLQALSGDSTPVFQGEAPSGYVLSVPKAGTITSFSFLSSGAKKGAAYAFAVLRPNGTTGTSWTLAYLGTAATVTSETGVDAVNGPYPVNVAVEPGDRIGLAPLEGTSEMVPIERGEAPFSVRFFANPFFTVGMSETVAPSSLTDTEKILPVQATLAVTPPTPTSPPVDQTPPTVSGTPKAEQALTCNPGSWTNEPSFAYTWSASTYELVPGSNKTPKVRTTTAQIGAGQNLVLPDLAPNTGVSCTVTATNPAVTAATAPKATSVPVGVLATKPVLAPSFSFVLHTKHNAPHITEGVGFPGTNVCDAGVWEHYPKEFTYEWFENTLLPRTHRVVSQQIATGRTLRIKIQYELHDVFCRVTATNSAGSTTATSNTVAVPRLAPKPLGPLNLIVYKPEPVRLNPVTSTHHPLLWKQSEPVFQLGCHAPRFSRKVLIASSWEIERETTAYPTGAGNGIFTFKPDTTVGGASLEITPNDPAHFGEPGKEPLFDGQLPSPIYYWTGNLALRCKVVARIPGTKLQTVLESPTLFLSAYWFVEG